MNSSKKAYKVTATVEGKMWLNRGTVLTADSEENAVEKARQKFTLTDEHTIKVEPVQVYSTESKLQTDNYPYGRERATAFFSVEHNKKGMRTVFQTINPRTGRINKPKNSTYTAVILPVELSNGFYDFCGYLDFNGTQEINTGLMFMADFHDLFTQDQIKQIAAHVIFMSKVNTKAMVMYAGSEFNDLKPLIEGSIETLVKIANTGANLWNEAKLDAAAIEATKKPEYNPFRVVQH